MKGYQEIGYFTFLVRVCVCAREEGVLGVNIVEEVGDTREAVVRQRFAFSSKVTIFLPPC